MKRIYDYDDNSDDDVDDDDTKITIISGVNREGMSH
jgi:hypothetical protein